MYSYLTDSRNALPFVKIVNKRGKLREKLTVVSFDVRSNYRNSPEKRLHKLMRTNCCTTDLSVLLEPAEGITQGSGYPFTVSCVFFILQLVAVDLHNFGST